MTRAIIIHGTLSQPTNNWFPWLAEELRAQGIDTVTPGLPTPDGQTLNNWRQVFVSAIGSLRVDDIVIGHSLACAFLCRMLQESPVTIDGAFFVAGFTEQVGNAQVDPLNESFVTAPFDWAVIRSRVRHIATYASDNDPYVPMQLAERFAALLNAPLITVPGAGHFNDAAGYNQFPQLRDDILRHYNSQRETQVMPVG